MKTCKYCLAADESARKAYEGTLKTLRAERAAEPTVKRRNAKLRGIKFIQARLAEPLFSGPCIWRKEEA